MQGLLGRHNNPTRLITSLHIHVKLVGIIVCVIQIQTMAKPKNYVETHILPQACHVLC